MKRSDFNTIIELPIEFDGRGSTKGFKFKQVYHNNGWYIYEVKGEYYEVFKEKIVKAMEYDNGWNTIEGVGKVTYPCDEDFGNSAWTYRNYEKALGCYEKIYAEGRTKIYGRWRRNCGVV